MSYVFGKKAPEKEKQGEKKKKEWEGRVI